VGRGEGRERGEEGRSRVREGARGGSEWKEAMKGSAWAEERVVSGRER